MTRLRRFLLCLSGVLCCLTFSIASADALKQAIDIDLTTTQESIDSQKHIDKISDQTQQMLEEYRTVTRHTETLSTYNKYLQDMLASQKEEKTSLSRQLSQIEVTQREVVPLILNMLDSLEQFVKLDLPFLPEEREQRLVLLKEMVNRADVTHAEKFRRILEAYQIENDYGNTIEAYRADIELHGVTSSVDFLRLGRVALYYQKLDGSETGFWNSQTQAWEALPSSYRNAVRNGLRIARKEAAPDLLTLPVSAPEAAQ
ncbi:MAG: DUF3450 domain-containing protein [Gammaproteobacteria bacterium]